MHVFLRKIDCISAFRGIFCFSETESKQCFLRRSFVGNRNFLFGIRFRDPVILCGFCENCGVSANVFKSFGKTVRKCGKPEFPAKFTYKSGVFGRAFGKKQGKTHRKPPVKRNSATYPHEFSTTCGKPFWKLSTVQTSKIWISKAF